MKITEENKSKYGKILIFCRLIIYMKRHIIVLLALKRIEC